MTSLYTYDAAYRPNLTLVRNAPGGIAINGYLTGDYANTTTQPAAARKAGLGYIATYEEGRSELVGASRATGRRVGDKIVAAFRAKGIPIRPDIAVYPSVDVNVPIDGTDRDADQCNTGWEGIRDVIDGDISVRSYAEGAVIDALSNAHLVDGKCWLAAPTSWAGFNVNDPRICMVQLVGTNVPGTDRNHLITDPHAIGAWWPDGSPYAQEAHPLSDLTKAQLDQIAQAFLDHPVPLANGSKPTLGHLLAVWQDWLQETDTKVGSVSTVVNTLPARVAQLQAAVAKLEPAAQVAIDVATIASATTDAVIAKLRGLVWGVK